MIRQARRDDLERLLGFQYAGVIICANGTLRLAFDWLADDTEH